MCTSNTSADSCSLAPHHHPAKAIVALAGQVQEPRPCCHVLMGISGPPLLLRKDFVWNDWTIYWGEIFLTSCSTSFRRFFYLMKNKNHYNKTIHLSCPYLCSFQVWVFGHFYWRQKCSSEFFSSKHLPQRLLHIGIQSVGKYSLTTVQR